MKLYPPESLTILGHRFVPMSRLDYEAFSGADEDSFICYLSDRTLITRRDSDIVTEILDDGSEQTWIGRPM